MRFVILGWVLLTVLLLGVLVYGSPMVVGSIVLEWSFLTLVTWFGLLSETRQIKAEPVS